MGETTHRLQALGLKGRRIKGLTCDIGQCNLAWVGIDGVTRIELSMEPGHMSMVPWFAVYEGDTLATMVNGLQVGTVCYFPPDLPKGEDTP